MRIPSPRRLLRRLHKDESGPETVEWVLLLIVAMIVLSGIYVFVGGAKKDVKSQTDALMNSTGWIQEQRVRPHRGPFDDPQPSGLMPDHA